MRQGIKIAVHCISGHPVATAVLSKALVKASGSSSLVNFWAQIMGLEPAWLGGYSLVEPVLVVWVATDCTTWSHICWLATVCQAKS